MNKIDDILYGFLLIKATFDPSIKKLYLSNDKYLEARKEYMRIIKTSDRTIRNKVDKMIFLGYISKGSNRLIFTQEHSAWEYVKYDMLKYLVATKSERSIKVYTYLLNKFKWKQNDPQGYSFTLKELALACGYSETSASTGAASIFRLIVEDLARTGVINFKTYNDGKSSRMRLIWVEQEYEKLKPVGQ